MMDWQQQPGRSLQAKLQICTCILFPTAAGLLFDQTCRVHSPFVPCKAIRPQEQQHTMHQAFESWQAWPSPPLLSCMLQPLDMHATASPPQQYLFSLLFLDLASSQNITGQAEAHWTRKTVLLQLNWITCLCSPSSMAQHFPYLPPNDASTWVTVLPWYAHCSHP